MQEWIDSEAIFHEDDGSEDNMSFRIKKFGWASGRVQKQSITNRGLMDYLHEPINDTRYTPDEFLALYGPNAGESESKALS